MRGLRGRLPGRRMVVVALPLALLGAIALVGASVAAPGDGAAAAAASRRAHPRPHHRRQAHHHRRRRTHRPGRHARRAFGATASPIKHVIVITGENHSFDNVFATYRPPAGQSIQNLLSEGIVTASGAPGPSVSKALQQQASDTTSYQIDPKDTGPYRTLPQPNSTYVPQACSGRAPGVADTRFPANLPNAPYPITKASRMI